MPLKKGPSKGLGKGLGALLASASGRTTVPLSPSAGSEGGETFDGQRLLRLPIEKVIPNPEQPRKDFPLPALEELAASLRRHGMIQPIAVSRRGNRWMIVAGERRWRAAQLAGFETIPAIEMQTSDLENMEFALVENLQREDLNPIDEARAYQLLMKKFGLSQEDLAARVGKGRATIANAIRLLKLSDEIQKEIVAGRLSSGHARAILSIENKERQKELCRLILTQGWSVRQAEQFAQRAQGATGGKKPARPPAVTVDANTRRLQDMLADAVKCRVKVHQNTKTSGRIEIVYTSLDELDRILSVFKIRMD